MKKYYLCLLTIIFSVHFYAQIPNASFENWTFNQPDGWTSKNNPPTTPWTFETQVNNTHLGNFAVKSEYVLCSSGSSYQVLNSGIYTGNATSHYYVPMGNNKPTKLFGWYIHYNMADSFTVDIRLKSGGLQIGSGTFATKTASPAYSQFTVNINYTSVAIPDSFHIAITWAHCPATTINCSCYQLSGTYYIVDDLSFDTNVGLIESSINKTIKLYPNPARSSLTIQTQEDITSLTIYDTIGESCNYKPLVSKSIDISDLPNGIYYLEVKTAKGFVHKKFVKE